mmetsp:Transcript_9256/g.25933  ORF Transcript_9256/g.25933 Transcript_9256/m.25933 type:complete len:234 (-) Transcript_9256:3440-4141(-)
MPRSWIDLRRATDTWPSFAAAMLSQEPCTLSTMLVAVVSTSSTCCISLPISCFASNHGPLIAFSTLASCAAKQSLASPTAPHTPLAAAVTAERTASGVATEQRPDSPTDVNADAASSSCFSVLWAFSTFSDMPLRMSDAALRSFFSSCFLFSYSSLFECSRLPSSTLLQSCSSFARITLSLGLIFESSAFASARGPSLHSRRSVLLALMKTDTFCAVARVVLRVLSMLLTNAA